MNDLIPFAVDYPQKYQGLSKGNKILARAPLFSADFFFGSGLLCLVKSMQTCSTGISRQTVSSPVPARVLPCPRMLTFKNYLRGKPALYGMETFITDATANLLS